MTAMIRRHETDKDVRNCFVECGFCRGAFRCTPNFNFYRVKDYEYWVCNFCIEGVLKEKGDAEGLKYVQSRNDS